MDIHHQESKEDGVKKTSKRMQRTKTGKGVQKIKQGGVKRQARGRKKTDKE